jgi:hypothetical protein
VRLYHLYGLAVMSDFDCPELTEITPEHAAARRYATVRLFRADGPLTLAEGRQLASWMWVTGDACLFQFDDIARLLVERSNGITVEMLPGANESDMRAYLFGAGFGTLAHMLGLVPLHVSAIRTPEGVVAFTGDSGAGKSTKVAELHFKHGWQIICDDVAVLHPNDDQPLLHAGMNRIKLWKDAVERFGIDPLRLTRDFMREDKYHLNAPEMFVDRPYALDGVVKLEGGGKEIKVTGGAIAFEALMNNVYRPEFAAIFADRRTLMKAISRAASALRL